MYDCDKTRVISTGKAPSTDYNAAYILNNNFGLTDASNFFPDRVWTIVQNADGQIVYLPDKQCSDKVCATYCDPRVRNAITGDLIKLDRVPYTGHVALENVYGEELRSYGQNYKSYGDIHAGQIQYRVSSEDKSAFQTPIYTLESSTVQTVRQDPMGGMIPEYYRTPVTNGLKNASNYQDTRDQLRYREDIMDGLRYQQNKSDYGVFWEHIIAEDHQATPWSYNS